MEVLRSKRGRSKPTRSHPLKKLHYLERYEREKIRGSDGSPSDHEEVLAIESEPTLNAYVSARARAVSEFLSMLADQRPDVTEYREKALNGRLLSSEEARATVDALGGVREDLHDLGRRLANDYLGWDQDGAIWYVLTGEAPRLRPIKVRGRGKFGGGYTKFQHEVTLTVLPWVPPKDVERVYRNIQRQVLVEKSRETGLRILEVAAFCWRQYRAEGREPAWSALIDLWNNGL